MTTYILTPNEQTNGIFTGNCYVFDTSGGFSVERGFPEIKLLASTPVSQYDVTNAVQIQFSVRTFNDRIGIIKDENNINTLQTTYNNETDLLETDSITISTADFLDGVNTASIRSMGKLSTLYSDFNETVRTYFGVPYGFSTLFSGVDDYSINQGVFDANAFIRIINGNTFDIAGSYVTDLSGYFQVNDINKHLRFACGTNVFGNRPAEGNFGIPNGFVEGDLLFIPNGINITLKVGIQPEPYTPIDNVGPTNLDSQRTKFNYSNPQQSIRKATTSTITEITQSYSVPILIILKNQDTFNFNNYGQVWNVVYPGPVNWLANSMSSNGQYQTAIEEFGDIYVSTDFGESWQVVYNIGNALCNCVSMSETGQYQTASNGTDIYISNDYGDTWTQVYSLGTSNIFVRISLTGQYQTIISCGDTVYTSSNYGMTWSGLPDQNSDLYYSIEAFPTAGLAMSYSGQYQTIVSETIYLSHDYGATWTRPIADDFEDRNWNTVAMSSNGEYQTALDSGGDIYVSIDYGQTWNMIDSVNVLDKQWQAIAMSASGKYQTALEKYGTVYISTDFGQSWMATQSGQMYNKVWQSIAVSSNGQYQSASEYGGAIYTSKLV